jgi:hypothetical protein
MAKSINWPLTFLTAVQTEPENHPFLAVRLGKLYFDNQYWVPDEIVDIRVNHEIVRQGKVVSPVQLTTVSELTTPQLAQLKPSLQSVDALINFLQSTYQPETPVSPETEITLVEYINLPLQPIDSI